MVLACGLLALLLIEAPRIFLSFTRWGEGNMASQAPSPFVFDANCSESGFVVYLKWLIDEKFVARENRALATLLCHMWKSY